MSEKARLVLTGVVMAAGFLLAGCGGEGLTGPGGGEDADVRELTVVPDPGQLGDDLEIPGRPGSADGPALDDDRRRPGFEDPDHR